MPAQAHFITALGARLAPLLIVGIAVPGTGCVVLKSQYDELEAQVFDLRKQDEKNAETLEKAEKLVTELEGKLKEVEEVLRRNQADLGLKVETVELEFAELRGIAENADLIASSSSQSLTELRADLDTRIKALEDKLNEATSIPETKTGLFAEANRQLRAAKYKLSRRLWRTYESRYPGDSKIPEVRFNIGLTHYSERDYKSALVAFYRVVEDSPKSKAIPDALYYSGLAYAKLGQCQNAVAYFTALRQKKTRAPSGYKKKAAEQIEHLRRDKGDICQDKVK